MPFISVATAPKVALFSVKRNPVVQNQIILTWTQINSKVINIYSTPLNLSILTTVLSSSEF